MNRIEHAKQLSDKKLDVSLSKIVAFLKSI